MVAYFKAYFEIIILTSKIKLLKLILWHLYKNFWFENNPLYGSYDISTKLNLDTSYRYNLIIMCIHVASYVCVQKGLRKAVITSYSKPLIILNTYMQ